MIQEIPQPTPMAVVSRVMAARCSAGPSLLTSPQFTTPGRVHARMLMSRKRAAVNGTVYFSKVRMT